MSVRDPLVMHVLLFKQASGDTNGDHKGIGANKTCR